MFVHDGTNFALVNMCKMNRINPKTIEYPRRVTSIVLNGEKFAIWAKQATFMMQLLSDFIGDFKYGI